MPKHKKPKLKMRVVSEGGLNPPRLPIVEKEAIIDMILSEYNKHLLEKLKERDNKNEKHTKASA